MKVRTRRAGMPTGRLQSRSGSGESAGARESIYESASTKAGKQRSRAIHSASPLGSNLINRIQMKSFVFDFVIATAGVLMLVKPLPAQELQPEKPKQFIYVLHLMPRLYA